jgi:hypothetical protein
MGIVISLISLVIAIGSVVCWIMVLIRMFKVKGILHGILGLICALYAFIWGWMVADEQGLKKIMIAWSIFVVLSMLFGFMSGAVAGNQ